LASATHAPRTVMLPQVVFVTHPPLVLVIHLLFGKYVSQSVFETSVVGAFAHVLLVHPLLEAFTVHVDK
jgi:hypothetical protein